eukprot:COSAG02_NODE_7407_length_3031_cov_1.984311_3_plen_69_part_00
MPRSQMFRNEMGLVVLSLRSDAKPQGLRTYSHCHATKPGRATFLFINVRISTLNGYQSTGLIAIVGGA